MKQTFFRTAWSMALVSSRFLPLPASFCPERSIGLKFFYAFLECIERGLDPLTTNLVVADLSRTEKTICFVVTPSLKACGISGRARLFEVAERVKQVNAGQLRKTPGHAFTGSSGNDPELKSHPELALDYLAAPPRMKLYMDYSARIFQVYCKYIAPGGRTS